MAELDEFALIRLLTEQGQSKAMNDECERGVIVGIGDNAAVLGTNAQYDLVVTCDTMVEEVHFNSFTMRDSDIGYKALASSLSDLAAMGAIAEYALVSISIPASCSTEQLKNVYKGIYECADTFGVRIVGGDTTSTPQYLTISVTALGTVEKGKALLRSSARTGDAMFITGELGCSAAGLHFLMANKLKGAVTDTAASHSAVGAYAVADSAAAHREVSGTAVDAASHSAEISDTTTDSVSARSVDITSVGGVANPYFAVSESIETLIEAHRRPTPQLLAGRILCRSDACHALNDISDGLASESWEIAEASAKGLLLFEEQIPVHPALQSYATDKGKDPLDWILYGGEDYQLVGTISPDHTASMRSLFMEAGLSFYIIGEVCEDFSGVRMKLKDGEIQIVKKKGYNHFPAKTDE